MENGSHGHGRRVIIDPMSDKIFSRFSGFIQAEVGIKMPPAKKTMLQARLQKRLWKLGIDSFDAYYEYVFSPKGREEELSHMIDVVTTNKTEFFREPKHFEFLIQRVLPELIEEQDGLDIRLTLWCAGCSTGEEPYTLAMVLKNYAEQQPGGGFRFLILATDVSSEVLQKARLGIYEEEMIEAVPMNFRKKYLLKSKTQDKGLVRVAPEIRALVKFRWLNLMKRDFQLRERMHIVFCRNVIIYFDRETQEKVVGHLCDYLVEGGYLFTGHSETLNGISLPVLPVAHTVYKKESRAARAQLELPIITLKPAELFVSDRPTIVRTVLGSCVAVTMYERRLGIAAICHILLPEESDLALNETQITGPYKYVNTAIPIMVERLRSYGVDPKQLETKVFGGADMLTSREKAANIPLVGKANVDAVIHAIKSLGLRLKVSDVGGVSGRKILFYTHTGEVLLKHLKPGAGEE